MGLSGPYGGATYGFAALVPMAALPKALLEKNTNESTRTKSPP